MALTLTRRQATGVNALITMARQNIARAKANAATGERLTEDQQAHAERWAHGETVLAMIGSATAPEACTTPEHPTQ